jgi:hypothetical protein
LNPNASRQSQDFGNSLSGRYSCGLGVTTFSPFSNDALFDLHGGFGVRLLFSMSELNKWNI